MNKVGSTGAPLERRTILLQQGGSAFGRPPPDAVGQKSPFLLDFQKVPRPVSPPSFPPPPPPLPYPCAQRFFLGLPRNKIQGKSKNHDVDHQLMPWKLDTDNKGLWKKRITPFLQEDMKVRYRSFLSLPLNFMPYTTPNGTVSRSTG